MRAAVVASLLGVAAALQSHLPHARPVRGRRSRHAPSMVLSDGAISTVSANNLKMTDSMRDYVEDKIGTVISKFAGVAQRCDTHLSVMRNPRRVPAAGAAAAAASAAAAATAPRAPAQVSDSDVAEVVVFCKGEVVRAEERSPSMYSSIDLVADKVARKLRKVKERKEGKRSKPKLKVSLAEAIEATALEEEPPLFDATTLIRKKKYPMPEQSLVDAMVCMDGLDHDFYMFKSEETGQINVIYKRGGRPRLIEPDSRRRPRSPPAPGALPARAGDRRPPPPAPPRRGAAPRRVATQQSGARRRRPPIDCRSIRRRRRWAEAAFEAL
ncbi:hypothetical protein JL721_5442 [Aureococcus anophagefferens]|nr:hypothetical protein JL721_5442 [Aureococcus anophagefferens]